MPRIRKTAIDKDWLDKSKALPDNKVLAAALLGKDYRHSDNAGDNNNSGRNDPGNGLPSQSCIIPYPEQVQSWVSQGIQSKTIYQALVSNHQFSGRYARTRPNQSD